MYRRKMFLLAFRIIVVLFFAGVLTNWIVLAFDQDVRAATNLLAFATGIIFTENLNALIRDLTRK